MNIRRLCRCISAAVPILALGACALNSNPAEITVYHGQGNSQAVSYEIGRQGRHGSSQRELELELPEGTRVCLNVLNAHTPGFSYALRVAVDSTPPTPPDFGGLLELLTSVLPQASGEAARVTERVLFPNVQSARILRLDELPSTLEEMIDIYKRRIAYLEMELNRSKEAIRLSLLPETLQPANLQVATGERRGLRYAQEVIGGLSSQPGHFNDPNLQQSIDGWKEAAEASPGGQTPSAKVVIEALHQQATTLLVARNAVRDTYMKAGPSWRECRAITNGATTVRLAATPRSPDGFTNQRDTLLVQVTATSDYRRNVVEIVPLAFLAFPRNKTGFGILNDTVVEDVKYAESASFRVGTMVTTTPFRFGRTNEWAFGPGIGTGIIGGDKPALSDFFLGALISWRDWLRLGAGYGISQAPARLINGAAVGETLPLDEGRDKLSDFIENDRVGTWFLTFTINGLKINLPGR